MKYVFGIALVLAFIMAGRQIIEPGITNIVFQDDWSDTAAQVGWRTGVAPPRSDEELRAIVIRKAAKHDIELSPKQVTVQRSGTPEYPVWYIAVDNSVPVNLPVYSYRLHFSPTSAGGKF